MIFGMSITILSIKNLLHVYVYFMTLFVYTVKWHIGNVFNMPSRQNAPTDRVLTSVILNGIEWTFRKVYPTKIPGMVHQGLLAPQSLPIFSIKVGCEGVTLHGFVFEMKQHRDNMKYCVAFSASKNLFCFFVFNEGSFYW